MGVLKGMALSGFASLAQGQSALALADAAAASSAAGTPLLALVDDSAAGLGFLHGARAVGPRLHAQRVGRDLDFMLGFARQLCSGQPMRVNRSTGRCVGEPPGASGAQCRCAYAVAWTTYRAGWPYPSLSAQRRYGRRLRGWRRYFFSAILLTDCNATDSVAKSTSGRARISLIVWRTCSTPRWLERVHAATACSGSRRRAPASACRHSVRCRL